MFTSRPERSGRWWMRRTTAIWSHLTLAFLLEQLSAPTAPQLSQRPRSVALGPGLWTLIKGAFRGAGHCRPGTTGVLQVKAAEDTQNCPVLSTANQKNEEKDEEILIWRQTTGVSLFIYFIVVSTLMHFHCKSCPELTQSPSNEGKKWDVVFYCRCTHQGHIFILESENLRGLKHYIQIESEACKASLHFLDKVLHIWTVL